MARLYPPITEEVLSAFCLNYDESYTNKISTSITIDFNLNRAVANAEIAGIVLRLRTISTNQYVITENLNENTNLGKSEGAAISYNLDEGKCTFIITAENNPEAINLLKIGQYYKAQIAFVDITGVIGYWSTVATIKCVAQPSVTIANYTPNDANIFMNELLGEYIQNTQTGDSTEKVYSYRFQLFDKQNNLLDDTGICLHNSSSDISSNSSTDSYQCYKELNTGESYYIIYSVTTINGLSVSSPRYQVIVSESIDPEDDITLLTRNGLETDVYEYNIPSGGFLTWAPWEEGLIEIKPDLESNINKLISPDGNLKPITGNFIILRSSSKDNFQTWQEIRRFRLTNEIPSNNIMYDYTVEQGVTYRYAIQQYNRQKLYSKKIYSYKRDVKGSVLYENTFPIYNDVTADFEDMFLYDGKRQLKIRFNPKVSSFKNDLQEQKIDTIGSKHPFIFRNGNVCYKEFPISGLISFQQDNVGLFFNEDDYKQMNLMRFEGEEKRDPRTSIKYIKLSRNEAIKAINNNIQLYWPKRQLKSFVNNMNGHEILKIDNYEVLKNKYNEESEYYSFTPVTSYIEAMTLLNDNIELYKLIEEKVEWALNGKNKKYLNHFDQKNYEKPVIYNKTDLTSENIMSERYFKLLVLDWLTDGRPKLFRSPTEGNYIVRLLNVSLTPKTELGRMIHEFTCTAYEVADFNYQSLRDFGLLNIEDINNIETQWYSKKINDLLTENNKGKDNYYSIDLENKSLTGFQATGFAPGDKIHILMSGEALPLEVTIGTTGTYIYDQGKKIVAISILPNDIAGDFSRTVLLATQGYISQPFDTIASITTHTQMGEQLVGPVENFFGKTIVGQGDKYYTSPNVNLIEGEGEKLRVSEILHLHAKKREVIPIFYNPDSSVYGNDLMIHQTNPYSLPTFSLTPYGQGYIQAKSIMPESGINVFNTNYNLPWGEGLGNLSEEELTKKREIKDLVDFVISKCNKDIFCLFQVYLPKKIDNTDKYTWAPYSENIFSQGSSNWGVNTYGIYDPWLYEQQTHWMSKTAQNTKQYMMGWWPKGLSLSDWDEVITPLRDYVKYDPTLTFHYSDEEDIVIDLDQTIEITLENIKVPNSITIGNGVIMEPIYRLQCIDYTIENEKTVLKNLKDIYFLTKAAAQERITQYRAAQNALTRGEYLSKKYNALLEMARDSENYLSIIKVLKDEAKTQQEEKLETYFSNEKSLVNMLETQLQILERELQQDSADFGYSLPKIYDTGTSLYETKRDYDSKWHPDIDKFEDETSSYNTHTKIINLIHTIDQYGFSQKIENIIQNIDYKISSLNSLLDDLGNQQYVGQYLENLDTKAKELYSAEISTFDVDIANKISEITEDSSIKYVYQLSNKDSDNLSTGIPVDLMNNKITAVNSEGKNLWNTKFYIDDSNDLTRLNISLVEGKGYSLEENNYNDDNLGNSFLKWLINNKIKSAIEEVNAAYESIGSGMTEEKYEQRWAPVKYVDGFSSVNDLQLGVVNEIDSEEKYTITREQHKLESVIDYLFLSEPVLKEAPPESKTLGDIVVEKLNETQYFFQNLPNQEDYNIKTKMESYVKTYIDSGAREKYQNIAACISYRENYKDSLTDGQKNIIKNTIQKFYEEKDNNESFSLQQFNALCFDTNSQSGLVNELEENDESIRKLLQDWKRDYEAVAISGSSQQDFNDKRKNLEDLIKFFNDIIELEKNQAKLFKEYQERYNNANVHYSYSDNIKEVLWEENNIYNSLKIKLNNIKIIFDNQLENFQNNIILEGYLKFLNTYIDAKNQTNSSDKDKYIQLLEEAKAMMKAKDNVSEEDNPYNQRQKVNIAWKNYLDALAQIYKKEIKERFG